MLKTRSIIASLTVLFLLSVVAPISKPTFAYYTNMPASMVVGQANFTSSSADQGGSAGANSIEGTRGVAVCHGKLVIADRLNNRVLIYNSIPTKNNTSADLVIGQSDFTATSANQGGSVAANTLNRPTGVFCVGTKLIIGDASNNRVLIFNNIPTANNASADIVMGQPDLSSNLANQGGSCAANTLKVDTEINATSDGSRLIVGDDGNNRVLVWNSIPTSNNASADLVFGQADFTSCTANRGGSPAANTLRQPRFGQIINGKLLVSDGGNRRHLIFNSVPNTNGVAADVVVGQSDFVSNSLNQGGSAGANTVTVANGFDVDANGRLFLVDQGNSRILVFNTIPTSNNTSADMVIGQTNFTSSSANQGGSVGSNTLSGLNHLEIYENFLFASDTDNNRILIFNNILSAPQLSVTGTDTVSDGKIRLSGNVVLGELGKYALQTLQASVNGQGLSDVTHRDGGRDQGSSDTIYEWYHEFEPWAGIGSRDTYDLGTGYTLKLRTSSYNAEEDNLFYFQPFSLNSVTGSVVPQITFAVNKSQWRQLKDSLDSFEIHVKQAGSDQWTVYADQLALSDENFDAGTGVVTLTTRAKPGIPLTSGKYQLKVVAKDKWGHRQETNSLETSLSGLSGAAYNPLNLAITKQWFPLQVNRIAGVRTGILASFNLTGFASAYTATTSSPVFEGIAFSGATVTLTVTDATTGQSRLYTTVAQDSRWMIKPLLYGKSVVALSVFDEAGRYNELPALSINRSQPVATPASAQ